jgi:hypothetical protein
MVKKYAYQESSHWRIILLNIKILFNHHSFHYYASNCAITATLEKFQPHLCNGKIKMCKHTFVILSVCLSDKVATKSETQVLFFENCKVCNLDTKRFACFNVYCHRLFWDALIPVEIVTPRWIWWKYRSENSIM